jgi:hypothetical protein
MAISAKATQNFVPIKEIRDGIVVLKDGGLRSVVLANSINLSLKSEDEQKAIIFQFQNFLNTLDFSVQISVQSRKLDIKPYLVMLENRMKVQTEPLLKLQTKEYIDFIKKFTDDVNIMTKSFYIVIPYTPKTFNTSSNPITGFFSKKTKEQAKLAEQVDFEEKRSQLEQRVNVIKQGLASCGIKSKELDTESIVELFYKVFNPGETEGKIEL